VQRPQYQRARVRPGIVHLGLNPFHCAHQAYYTEQVLNQLGGDWGIIGCCLGAAAMHQRLAPQDGYFTLVERTPEGDRLQLIGALVDTLHAPADPAALVEVMAADSIKIITLSISPQGYCLDPVTHQLDVNRADISHDLQDLDAPCAALGFLVAALEKRYERGGRGLGLLSCDPLVRNGDQLKQALIQFAARLSHDLPVWIQDNVTFPNSLAQRQLLELSPGELAEITERLGLRDEALVVCEAASRWVIEDKFVDGRPAWETAGALMVADIDTINP